MKNVIAILMIVLTLVSSTHITMALHFCNGDLQSVDLITLGDSSCCGEHKKEGSVQRIVTIQGVPCCENTHLEMDSDSYSISEQINSIKNDSDFPPISLIYSSQQLFDLEDEERNSLGNHFHSDHINKSGFDLLISISTLII